MRKLRPQNRISKVVDLIDSNNIELLDNNGLKYVITGPVPSKKLIEFQSLLDTLSIKEVKLLKLNYL